MSRRQLNHDDPAQSAEIDRQIDEIRMGERPDSPVYKSLTRMRIERDAWLAFLGSIGTSDDLRAELERASMAGFSPGWLKLWVHHKSSAERLGAKAPFLGFLVAEWWARSVVKRPTSAPQVIEVAGPGPSDVFRWESPAAKEEP